MSDSQKLPDLDRQKTDESLRTERASADLLIEKSPGVDEIADAVISRARLRAEAVLAAARNRDDDRSVRNPSRSRLAHLVTMDRAREDRVLREENAAADELLSAERAQQKSIFEKEREETDRSLQDERGRSDDALAIRDEFLGIVCHDLRSILSAVILFAGLIEENAESKREDDIIKYAQSIRRGGAQMSRLVGDLMDVASIKAGALAVRYESTDAALLVAEAVETLQAQAAAKRISLRAEIVAPLAAIELDAARIMQVLCNIVSNAVKFTPAGGKVTVRAESIGADLSMCIEDTG